MILHYKFRHFEHVFDIRARPAERHESIKKPESRIAVPARFLLHKARQTAAADLSTVSNSQNHFRIRRSVEQLFPVNISRNVLIR